MQFRFLLTALPALVAAAYDNETVITITEHSVVTEFTTYCPESTTLTFNNKTYTVTEPTTLTITDCPCTLESTTISTLESTSTPITYESTSAPIGTISTSSKAPESTSAPLTYTSTSSEISTFEGVANLNKVSVGLLAALFAALV